TAIGRAAVSTNMGLRQYTGVHGRQKRFSPPVFNCVFGASDRSRTRKTRAAYIPLAVGEAPGGAAGAGRLDRHRDHRASPGSRRVQGNACPGYTSHAGSHDRSVGRGTARAAPKYVLDTQLYIRAFRDPAANPELQEFHLARAPFEYLSSVVAQELRAGIR